MKKLDTELLVGCLLLVGIGVLVYISVSLGNLDLTGSWGYPLEASFSTAGGLQPGAVIELAGVEIGRVEAVDLIDYHAQATLKIRRDIALSEDVRAAIKSKGLIGERYIEIIPGRASEKLKPGQQIRDTEPPVDIQELISKFIFGNVEKGEQE